MGQETAYVSHTCEQHLHACEVSVAPRTPSQRGEGASATASVPNSQQNSEAASHVSLFRHEPVESSQPSICFANGKVREVAAQHPNVLRSCAFLRRAASSKGNKHEKETDLPFVQRGIQDPASRVPLCPVSLLRAHEYISALPTKMPGRPFARRPNVIRS